MRHPVGLTLIALSLLPACGPGQAGDTTGETAATSTGEAVSTGEAPTTGQASETGPEQTGGTAPGTSTDDETTSPALTTGETLGETTLGETTLGETTIDETTGSDTELSTSSGASSTTGEEETGTPAELVTKAWWVDGAESLQIRIIQADPEAGLCRGVWLTVLDFGPNGFDPVMAPPPWEVRHVWVHQDLDNCFNPYTWYEFGAVFGDTATGTVEFHDMDNEGKPATLDIDVTGGGYKPAEPWTPTMDTLTAVGVPVVVG